MGKNQRRSYLHPTDSLDYDAGPTTRHAVWKKNKATLWYYPAPTKRYKEPVYLVYSLANKPYILDLGPSISFIQALTNAGYDAYLIDFGIPAFEDRFISIDDYIVKYIDKGYQRALRHAGVDEMNIIGFCLGGTLAAIHAAFTKEKIKNLILAVTPIDFHSFPDYDKWLLALRNGEVDINELTDRIGIVPATFIKYGTKMIVAPITFSHYLSLLKLPPDPKHLYKWTRMNEWTNDHIPFTGEAGKKIMNDFIRDNKVLKGGLTINGEIIDFKNITCNFLGFATKNDPLVPSNLCEPIVDLISSEDKTFKLLEAGHISLVTKEKLMDFMDLWLEEHSTPL
ncbi:alpha/beta fold hydrolase [Niallia sp. 01092]|uniref:alpha/beta fold hydrolase n=1 Tax=unclassified Niallia TaxID=2837522 RepID=UPI003FCF34FC